MARTKTPARAVYHLAQMWMCAFSIHGTGVLEVCYGFVFKMTDFHNNSLPWLRVRTERVFYIKTLSLQTENGTRAGRWDMSVWLLLGQTQRDRRDL